MAGVLETQQKVQRGRVPRPRGGGDGRPRIIRVVIVATAILAALIFGYRYLRSPDRAMSSTNVTMRVKIDAELGARVSLKGGRMTVAVFESAVGSTERTADGGLDFPIEIGIEGLKRIIDGLGGILINIPETIEYRRSNGLPVRIDAGMRRLDADRVESYLRRQNASRPASLRAVVLGITSRASELTASKVNLDRILEASLEPSARGADGRNAARLSALLRAASNLGPTEISVEWGAAPLPITAQTPPGNAVAVEAPVSRVTSPLRVRILNGTGKPGLAARAAFNLPSPRFEVIETANADRFGYAKTLVRTADAAAAQEVIDILGVGRAEAIAASALRDADLEVILGNDAKNHW